MDPTVLSEIWAPKLPPAGWTLELGASGNVTFTAEDARASVWAWPRRRRAAA
jgi:hypothetical protein